ncbi:hypothetical protein BS50DRAFT_523339 [Corynespora cassiicola Philippines]|uniref:Uncharacterized protein n=1 Tax=Corynespora cassiicola Philippines TaxID=1448308 RepID=A0A2T2NSG5_CORCC|nr:hypothetical protein BS50DRAFT_523339 [Corynespora cassiicola Philippines]
MKTTYILTSLFAILAAASPLDISARQNSIRVQLSDDSVEAAVQSNIPANGSRVNIRTAFGNLGNPVQANRAGIVSGTGSCTIYRDAAATQRVATFRSGGADATFTRTNLNNGVIVCQ